MPQNKNHKSKNILTASIQEKCIVSKVKDEELFIKKAKDLEKRIGVHGNTRLALMNILEDVEKARDQALEERDKTLAIITNFSDGLLLLDREDQFQLINPKAQEYFRLDPLLSGELGGKATSELTQYPELKSLANLLGRKLKKVERKKLVVRDNLILEVSVVPILSDKVKVGTLIILHDITKDKIIEKMKTQFVSIAAHQLRTPLSAIKWSLRTVLSGDVGKLARDQEKILETTYQSNERMIMLINDLLNVSRIEEGRFLYEIKKYDLIKIIKQTISNVSEIIKNKKLNFSFDYFKNVIPKVYLDSEKMQLAIQNLVDNAVHYTRSNGKIDISVKSDVKQENINFSIKDTGIGIPRDQQNRVFTTFFRAANAMRSETEGSGLGLYIAKNIIEAHQGKISFKSNENKGSTFFFTIPVSQKLKRKPQI